MKSLCALVLMVATALTLRAAAPEDLFERANHKYAAGDFRAAIADYENIVGTRAWSANLFYNLGNAYDRAEDYGHAILSYKRALALEPSHPEAKANLQLAHDQARAMTATIQGWQRTLGSLNENISAVAAAIFFWIGLGLLLWRPRGGAIVIASLSIALALALGGTFFLRGQEREGRAIVIEPKVEARVATADSAKSILAMPPGSEVKILQQRGDWSYAVLPNGERGWIPAKAAELIRL